MSSFKDLFTPQAADYARFRPVYPPELYAWLAAQAPARALARSSINPRGILYCPAGCSQARGDAAPHPSGPLACGA